MVMARIKFRRLFPLVEDLLKNPVNYSYHRALYCLEKYWLKDNLYFNPQQLSLFAAPELSFPASDLRRIQIDTYGHVSLELNFMGLYGVDSPLPRYFSQEAIKDTLLANRLKILLNVLTQKIYVYHYLAWRFFNEGVNNELGDQGYVNFIASLTRIKNTDDYFMRYAASYMLKSRSAMNLRSILIDLFKTDAIDILKFKTRTIEVLTFGLGTKLYLNRNSLLGRYTVANRSVEIKISKVNWVVIETFLLNTAKRDKILRVIQNFLPTHMSYQLNFDYKLSEETRSYLGSVKNCLGWRTVLGQPNAAYQLSIYFS